MIGRQPVSRFIEHFVVQRRGVHRYLAADKVVHMHLLVFGHHEADDPLVAPFDTRAHFLVGHGQRGRQPASYLIIICESVAPLFRFRTQGIQSLRSIEGIVGITRLDQPQGVLQIDFLSFALPVGSVRTTFAYPFVGPDTAPLQGIEYVLLRSRHVTVRVGILDADDEVAAGPACEQIVVQCRSDTTHMQGACRTRRETNPYPSLRHLYIAFM